MRPRRDPDGRCGSCDVRLARVDADHEEYCGREVDGWPPFRDDDPLPVTAQLCDRCGGEGQLYTSRYGGNDPDVWPTGECPVCDGTGYALYETEEIEEEEVMLS